MKLTLGFSPCPNDTFIFDAMVNGKIDTGEFEFDVVLEDIQTLNVWSQEQRLDITKLSFPAFFSSQHYRMLRAGGAVGNGVGPLLVAKKMVDVRDLAHARIAVPGFNTTANFLLTYTFPTAVNKVPMLFSQIEDAVAHEEVDLGVIIHENRFTYQQKGLHQICDLGAIWEEREHSPIPLACIAARDNIDLQVQDAISALIRQSVEYAWTQYPEISGYTRQHAQAMDEKVMRQHIELYVNDYSKDLSTAMDAIEKFQQIHATLLNVEC
ncbi:MAG TPA: 1,4-dihydroxy-6-naphthoate synthase [Flavisolibacter sp.]